MKRCFLFIVCCLLGQFVVIAQVVPDRYPSVSPVGVFVAHDGEEEIEPGGSYDAPLVVTFSANPTDTVGYEVLYQWKIEQIKDNGVRLLTMRNEETTTFTFTEGGANVSYRVGLAITYRHRESDVEGSVEQETSEMLTFSLRGSTLELFNAFSPNGDGTNDVYRVRTKSLLSFRMKIFNRWGQEIVSGNQNSLPIEYTDANGNVDGYTYYVCWDGTYHGSRVEDGVFFILVEAEGADGIKYVKRGDINVLTRLRKEDKQ